MELKRCLHLPELLSKKSSFLLGPRATGNTTLIKRQFAKSARILDLLNSRLYLRLSSSPHNLEALIGPDHDKTIVVGRDFKKYFLVSQDPTRAVYGDFQAVHYADFLDQLWNEEPKQ